MHSGSVKAIHIEAKVKAKLYDLGMTITMEKKIEFPGSHFRGLFLPFNLGINNPL
jgi:hypothetical protein